MYKLPKFENLKLKAPEVKLLKFWKRRDFWTIILTIFLSSLFGFLAGAISGSYFSSEFEDYLKKLNIKVPEPKKIEQVIEKEPTGLSQMSQEEAVIRVVKEVSPSVVSIIVSKDLPVFERYFEEPFKEFEEFFGPFKIPRYRQKGVEKKEIGGGTGFIISEDGLVLTNKHVVLEEAADYVVLMNDGRKFEAKVLARDPAQDLAILKIQSNEKFQVAVLGDSQELEVGQTVIAIGNVLGEFRNSVSVGVIAGLGRKITASGGGLVETLEDVIQTDAAINKGNSGGPLLNLKGEVIGVNTAMAFGAENIGFAIPINKAKKDIKQVKELGKIVYPFLGVRYVVITKDIQLENNLPVDYGAWILGGVGEPAIVPGSAAHIAGLKEGDIILEFNNEKITLENSLAKIISKYNPGDKVVLKILRQGEEKIVEIILGEKSG